MTRRQNSPELNDRSRHVLKVLVERYIRDGEPVGSRTLSRESGLDLSPATIRNIMADLEDMDMVRSPHTSAGRVPSQKGYRLFVDSLLTVKSPPKNEVRLIEQSLKAHDDTPQELLNSASVLISRITRLAGLVSVPKRDHAHWRQIEFLPLSDNRVLAILVVNEKDVQNRILHLDRPYKEAELTQVANYLNQHFAGLSLTEVRNKLLTDMRDTRETMNQMMFTAISMAEKVFDVTNDGEFLLSGQTNLMGFAELSDIDKLRRLFEAFSHKRDILHLLDQCIAAEGVQIFIGEECGYQLLDEVSIVTAPYEVDGELLGVLGVIGPTRMAYERIIPIVDLTAKFLSVALKTNA